MADEILIFLMRLSQLGAFFVEHPTPLHRPQGASTVNGSKKATEERPPLDA
jgi:hypothetical protein